MAKKKNTRSKPREVVVTHRVTGYQIQIKGPVRNEAMMTLFEGLRSKLIAGKPLARSDQYGVVVRSLEAYDGAVPNSLVLSLVKYNSKKTGLSWDTNKEVLFEDNSNVTAQKTLLIIYPDEHIAYHIHKTHGPTPSQIEFYLDAIFNRERIAKKLDCEIEILPLKVGGDIKKLHRWKVIKKFSIEVIRPNPSGVIRAKRLRDLLKQSEADKVALELAAKVEAGIKRTSISDLIDEGAKLVTDGQGRVQAEGLNSSNQKDILDSNDTKVKYSEIKTTSSDFRTIEEIIWSFFGPNRRR